MMRSYLYTRLFQCFFTVLFLTTALLFSSSGFAQLTPASCKNVQCTSNDVRIVSAYISGPGNAAIDCSSPQPFHNAELHLVVFSNTQRIGVSISGYLNSDNTPHVIGQCYTGETLNSGSNNNLVYQLGSQLDAVTCQTDFSLTSLFISWGTGNTDFCETNLDPRVATDPNCPATPAKCRYVDGEKIIVDVKLDIDFSWVTGDCTQNQNSLKVDFAPILTASGITYPVTFDWDFGDGKTAQTSASDFAGVADAGTSHTYENAGKYTIKLTVTDKSETPNIKSTLHTVTLVSCCNLAAPEVTAGPFCVADAKTIADLPQNDGNGGTYQWFEGSDPDIYDMPILGTTVIPPGTNYYYVSVSKNDCVSARTKVIVVVQEASDAPTVNNITYCKDEIAVALTATGSNLKWYNAGGELLSEAPTPSTATVGMTKYYVTQTETDKCESAKAEIVVTIKDNSALPIVVSDIYYCKDQTPAVLTATGSNLKWYDANGTLLNGAPTPSTGSLGSTVYYVTQTETGKCESAKVKITVNVNTCAITYTQGFWGGTTANGTNCEGVKLSSFLPALLNTTPVQYVGTSERNLTLNNATKLISIMPGGGYVKNVFDAQYGLVSTATTPTVLPTTYLDKKTKKLNSVVISQTIALKLNVLYKAALGTVAFEPNKYILNTSTLTYVSTKSCSVKSVSSTTSSFPMSSKVLCYLFSNNAYTKDINGLLQLANNVVGGNLNISTGSPFSYSELVQTLDAINRGFDRGAMLKSYSGYYACNIPAVTQRAANGLIVAEQPTSLSVSAYPNPYNSNVRFTVANPKAGQGSLEVFNLLGQKVSTVYHGFIPAGTQTYNLNLSPIHRTNLIYRLSVNGNQVTGKLLHASE